MLIVALLKKLKARFGLIPSEPPLLLAREWGVVVFVMAFMGALVILAEVEHVRSRSLVQSEIALRDKKKIDVVLTGAVKHPGLYRCDPGTSLRELLKEAQLLKTADRRQIILNKLFYSSQEVEIPIKKRSI